MKLNLREIIEIPGGSVPFAQELDTALLDFPSVRAYTAPITAFVSGSCTSAVSGALVLRVT